MATASTSSLLQSATTSLQSEHRQGSRKRKQDMPSAAAQGSVTVTHSSVANQEPRERMPQVNTKSVTACIAAVASFDIPEHLVKQCAEDMLNQGKLLNAATLLQECELRYPPDSHQSYSYLERVRNNNNSANNSSNQIDTGATSLSPDVNEGSLSSSANARPGLISDIGRPNSSGSASGEVHGESRRSSGVDSNAAGRTSNSDSHLTAQSSEPDSEGEDMPDGFLSSSLFRDSLDSLHGQRQVDCADSSTAFNSTATGEISSPGLLNMASSVSNGLHNGLSRPNYTPGLMLSRDLELLRHRQNDGSGTNINNSRSVNACSHNSLTDLEHSSVSDTNRDDINSIQQATAKLRRESIAIARPPFSSNAEFVNTCFRLIEREHELLERSRKCSQCSEKPREVTFLPCGHFTVCRQCSDPLYVCPSCNKSILATVDTYLS